MFYPICLCNALLFRRVAMCVQCICVYAMCVMQCKNMQLCMQYMYVMCVCNVYAIYICNGHAMCVCNVCIACI